MNSHHLGVLRFFALLFLLPGLGGLIVSAWVSANYLETLPRMPLPAEARMTPRDIHGVIVYQTVAEDRRLSIMEDSSVGIFAVGLTLGLVYMRKWGIAQALTGSEDDDMVPENNG